jgi:hypothetical protein
LSIAGLNGATGPSPADGPAAEGSDCSGLADAQERSRGKARRQKNEEPLGGKYFLAMLLMVFMVFIKKFNRGSSKMSDFGTATLKMRFRKALA